MEGEGILIVQQDAECGTFRGICREGGMVEDRARLDEGRRDAEGRRGPEAQRDGHVTMAEERRADAVVTGQDLLQGKAVGQTDLVKGGHAHIAGRMVQKQKPRAGFGRKTVFQPCKLVGAERPVRLARHIGVEQIAGRAIGQNMPLVDLRPGLENATVRVRQVVIAQCHMDGPGQIPKHLLKLAVFVFRSVIGQVAQNNQSLRIRMVRRHIMQDTRQIFCGIAVMTGSLATQMQIAEQQEFPERAHSVVPRTIRLTGIRR